MFKFIVIVFVVATVNLAEMVTGTPGDFADAAETVDVPPEHRAAAPAPALPQPYPGQPPYQPRAVFPVAAVPGGPQYPLFFTTQNGFVPFGNIYGAYQQPPRAIVQSPAYFLPPDQPIASPIAAAAL